MDVQTERDWNKRIRVGERHIEDAKRTRRLFVIAVLGAIVFTGAWVFFSIVISPEFAWCALVTLWGGAGVTWWGNGDNPFQSVRDWERKVEDLREEYAYAMMDA